jgi:hypothetical protein
MRGRQRSRKAELQNPAVVDVAEEISNSNKLNRAPRLASNGFLFGDS